MPTTGSQRPRGRPRTPNGETRVISIRAELGDAKLIESQIAKPQLRNSSKMKLSNAQIVMLALEQYAAAVDERRNFENKKNEPAPAPTLKPTRKLQEIDRRLDERRRRRAQVTGRTYDLWSDQP